MSRPEEYKIEKTVWRSGRKNDFGDELVVTEGYVNNQFAYIMAWEVNTERPETVSWNGEVSWFPRMYWIDNIPPGHIKVHNYSMGKDYLIKEHGDNIPIMKSIKRTIDPNNIMNPGKIFDLN